MPQLIWSGTDEQEKYHDEDRGVIYWPSDRAVTVTQPVAEKYLEHEGWSVADDGDNLIGRVLNEHDRATQGGPIGTEEADAGDTTGGDEANDGDSPEVVTVDTEHGGSGGGSSDSSPSRTETLDDDGYQKETAESVDVETSAESTAVEVESENVPEPEAAKNGFDADEFVDGYWSTVSSQIRDGHADGHLEDVRVAEKERSGDNRDSSVLAAIDDRQAELSDDPDSE